MARTVDELVEQQLKWLPDGYETATELLAGIAAALREGELAGETLQPLATIGGASGKWLTLQAHGYGIERAPGESDASVRARMRRVVDKVTKPAIIAAVDALIEPDTCDVIEWWEGPYLDVEDDEGMWLDSSRISGGPNFFLVVIPVQDGVGFAVGAYLDTDLYLDSSYVGEPAEPAIYGIIINEVERTRAAGTSWRLVLET